MSKQINVKVNFKDIDKSFSKSNVSKARYAMATDIHRDMNRYVPADKYHLRNNSKLSSDGKNVNYSEKYADRQYKNKFKHYTTSGTGPEWDKVAAKKHMKEWERTFLKGLNL